VKTESRAKSCINSQKRTIATRCDVYRIYIWRCNRTEHSSVKLHRPLMRGGLYTLRLRSQESLQNFRRYILYFPHIRSLLKYNVDIMLTSDTSPLSLMLYLDAFTLNTKLPSTTWCTTTEQNWRTHKWNYVHLTIECNMSNDITLIRQLCLHYNHHNSSTLSTQPDRFCSGQDKRRVLYIRKRIASRAETATAICWSFPIRYINKQGYNFLTLTLRWPA